MLGCPYLLYFVLVQHYGFPSDTLFSGREDDDLELRFPPSHHSHRRCIVVTDEAEFAQLEANIPGTPWLLGLEVNAEE